jgi:hypothetical protein
MGLRNSPVPGAIPSLTGERITGFLAGRLAMSDRVPIASCGCEEVDPQVEIVIMESRPCDFRNYLPMVRVKAIGRTSKSKWKSRPFAPPAHDIEVSEQEPVEQLLFLRLRSGWNQPIHATPAPQKLICLAGAVRVIASDGEAREIRKEMFGTCKIAAAKVIIHA